MRPRSQSSSSGARTRARFVAIVAATLASTAFAQEPGERGPREETLGELPQLVLSVEERECVGSAALRAAVAAWAPRVEAATTVVVEPRGSGTEFAVLREGVSLGRRRFDRLPAVCAHRLAALSLAIAIALDAQVLDRMGVSAEPPRGAEPTQRAEPPSAEPRPRAPTPLPDGSTSSPHVSRIGLQGSVRLGLAVGAPRGWTGLAGLGLRIVHRRWAVELDAAGTLRRSFALGAGSVALQWAGARVGVCLGRGERLRIDGCVGGVVGAVFAQGQGFGENREVRQALAGVDASLAARFPASSVLAFEVRLRGHVNVLRPRWVVRSDDATVASATTDPVGATLEIGAVANFW